MTLTLSVFTAQDGGMHHQSSMKIITNCSEVTHFKLTTYSFRFSGRLVIRFSCLAYWKYELELKQPIKMSLLNDAGGL